ncbi:hypothetical protein ACF3NT_05640 [Naumannella halotolerans]|nr:hypothetical protein [Naumannella halotolerans]
MGSQPTSSIDWDSMGQPEFDRIVEALIHRIEPADATVRAYEGRGGDGGKDVEVLYPAGNRKVYQLKYFLGRETGMGVSRRRQVKKSLKKVMEGDVPPEEWVLVAPCKFTPADYTFIDQLVADYQLEHAVWDRPKLDELLARHLDLAANHLRHDYALEMIKIAGMEAAALTNGAADVVDRMHSLGSVIDGVDPNWGMDVSRVDGLVCVSPRAKHSRSAEVAPISITTEVEFGAEDHVLRDAFRKSVGFGSSRPVRIPAENVRSFKIEGPPLFAREGRNGEIELGIHSEARLVDRPVNVRLLGGGGQFIGGYVGVTKHVGRGTEGVTLELGFASNLVTLEMQFVPTSPNSPVSAALSYEVPEGLMPEVHLEATRLMLDLRTTEVLELEVDGMRAGRFAGVGSGLLADTEFVDVLRTVNQAAEDLVVVQRVTNDRFAMPPELDGRSRAWCRAIRLISEGRCVLAPDLWRPTMTLTPAEQVGDSDPFYQGQPVTFYARRTPFTVEIYGRKIIAMPIEMWHPAVRVVDAASARQSLLAGEQVKVALAAAEPEQRWWLVDAEKYVGADPLQLTAWDLEGIDNPPVPSFVAELPSEVSGE